MECYRPEAIVLQCGADSLYGDRYVRIIYRAYYGLILIYFK